MIRLSIFKKILQDAIDAEWDEDIYYYNCPPEKYDYEAKGEEEPQDIDPDSVPDDSKDGLTTREKNVQENYRSILPWLGNN